MVLHRHGYFRRQRKRRRRLQRDFWKLRFDGLTHHGQYHYSGTSCDGSGKGLLLTNAVVVTLLFQDYLPTPQFLVSSFKHSAPSSQLPAPGLWLWALVLAKCLPLRIIQTEKGFDITLKIEV